MHSNTLKSKALTGIIWSAINKFSVQGGQFAIGIILARLLMPQDFGLIGMISIFLAISQSFVDSGMGSGLIQKKNRTDIDFSTVFVCNLVVSITFYLVLFFSAPLIADFFKTPQLTPLTRVLALNIIINSLALVQRTRLTINIDFKTLAKVNVVAVFIAGIVAIALAYNDWGVWALVFQSIVNSLIMVALLWYLSRWKPSILFSKQSFKALFGFGSKLLLSGLYAQAFVNIYNITIGKFYSASTLGYYTRAKSFSDMTAGTVSSILQQVTYPILASVQDDRTRMVSIYRRMIGMTSFVIFPIMTLLALLADPFIRLFLTEKWAPAIVLLQWLCFARVVTPISSINMNILNAMGRSDLFLKVDLSKAPIIITILIITIPIGVKAIVIGNVITSLIAYFINAYLPGKILGYGALKQLRDVKTILFATFIMSLMVFLSLLGIENHLLKLIIGGLVGLITYLSMSSILKIEEFNELKILLMKIRRK